MSKNSKKQNFTFEVDSALLRELGERLVVTEHLALVELVKNSYDADATQVTVKIDVFENQRIITISDNGKGMTLDEVQNYWMVIANTNKLENNVSTKYGRDKTGSKGIGRFSCRRLGEKLDLRTHAINAKGKTEYTEISFNWKSFTPGEKITSISLEGIHEIIEEKKQGTTLVIQKENYSQWHDYQKKYIERNLSLYTINREIKRKGYKTDPGFNITIYFDEEESNVINLHDKIIDSGWGTLSASLNEDGNAVCSLEALDVGIVNITSDLKFKKLKGIELKIGIIPSKKDHLRNSAIFSMGLLTDILPIWGGIYVKQDGFRIFPYGQEGDDWLNIDKDRGRSKAQNTDNIQLLNEVKKFKLNDNRYLLALLSSHSYVGEVNVPKNENLFEIKANREGFIESEELNELRNFVRFAIDWATVYRHYFINKRFSQLYKETVNIDSVKKERSGLKIGSDNIIKATFSSLQKQISNEVAPEEEKKVKKIFKKYQRFTEEYENQLNAELDHLRIISSSSILLLIFAHEIKSFLGQYDVSTENLKLIASNLSRKDSDKILKVYNELAEFKDRFYSLLDMVSTVSLKDKIVKEGKFNLVKRVETSLDCFKLICEEYDIKINISDLGTGVQVGPIYEAELFSILLNILSNSIKALIASGNENKMIHLSSEKEKSKTHLCILDNGIGIDEKNYNLVFERFISDPEDDLYNSLDEKVNPKDRYILGGGSGIGLNIVKDIVLKYSGKIYFSKPKEGWNAELHILI